MSTFAAAALLLVSSTTTFAQGDAFPTAGDHPIKMSNSHLNTFGSLLSGAVALGLIGLLASHPHYGNLTTELEKNGPRVSEHCSADYFEVQEFAQGGWPVVVVYEAKKTCSVKLEVTQGDNSASSWKLDGAPIGQQETVVFLPVSFSTQPTPARFLFTAETDDGAPASIDFVAIGCGPGAVGSLNVDKLFFGPPQRRTVERANYKLRPLVQFDSGTVQILKLTASEDRIVRTPQPNPESLHALREGVTVGENPDHPWPMLNVSKTPSPGLYRMRVTLKDNPTSPRSWLIVDWTDIVQIRR